MDTPTFYHKEEMLADPFQEANNDTSTQANIAPDDHITTVESVLSSEKPPTSDDLETPAMQMGPPDVLMGTPVKSQGSSNDQTDFNLELRIASNENEESLLQNIEPMPDTINSGANQQSHIINDIEEEKEEQQSFSLDGQS